MDDSKFMGDFFCYFPGIRERHVRNETIGKTEVGKKIINELDKIIKETNFDIKALNKEMDSQTENFCKWRELFEEGKEVESEKYGQKNQEHANQMKEMIYPIYLKMLELGYEKKDLHFLR